MNQSSSSSTRGWTPSTRVRKAAAVEVTAPVWAWMRTKRERRERRVSSLRKRVKCKVRNGPF